MNKTSKFLFSTLVAAAAMTSTAWAEGTETEISSVDEIKSALSALNAANGGTIDFGEIVYEYRDVLSNDADMATITNAGSYTITGGCGALLNYELEINPSKLSGEYVLNLDDAHVTMTKVTLRENATLSLVNSRLDYNGFQGGSAYLSVYSNSKLILSNSILGYDSHKTGVANPEDYTHTNSSADFFGPRIAIYGSAEISNSTIYTGPGQGTHEGFDVLGNGTATLSGSALHTNLINVGSRLEEGRLSAGTDKNDLSAMLTLNNAKVDNIQYRGDYTSVSGICVGADNWAGTLNIENGSEIDMTVVKYTDGREQGLAVGAKGTVNVSDSSVKVLKVSNNGAIMIQDSTFSAGSITNNGSFTLSGNSSLNIATLTGNNMIQVVGDTTLVDSTIGGNVAVGYGDYTDQPATLTLAGTSKIGGVLYVGDEKTVGAYKLNVTGNTTIGQLLSRTESVVNISNDANVSIGYWQNKGATTIDNASVEVTGVNFYVYNNDSDSLASITLKNGANLTATGLAKNVGLVLGNTEATPAKGHAALYLEGGSTVSLSELQLRPTVNGDKTYKIEVAAKEHSTIDVVDAVVIGSGATVSLTDSTLKAASVNGSGRIIGNGEVELKFDSSSAQVLVGGYYDAEGNRQYNDGGALRSTLVLDDVSGNGVMIKDKEFRVNNADITLNADVTADLGNGVYFYLRESNLNLNGKNLTVDGGKLVTSNLELSGTGTVTITGKTEMPCWQGNNNVVGEDVTVNSGIQINVYGALTVYGTLNTAETGHGNGADRIGYTPWNSTHDAVLILSGEKASYTQSGNYGLVIDGKNNGLIVENGASVSLGGGTATNNGIISIDGSSFSAAGTIVNNYYLLVQNGASLSAGKIVNNNSFDIYNSTLENQTISGSGYVYAENALLNNISVSGNTVYMMGTNVNGGTFATVYNGYGVVNGEWQTAGDTESVISGNVVAGSWYDYGKTTVASGATVTATNFYAQGTNGATIDGTVEVSGIFRGYNGTISESGKVVAGTAVHLYGNTTNQREYNIKGELIASNDGNHASVFEVGSAYVKQYYGDNGEYWSIGGANTVVNVSGSVTLKAGKYGAANARVNVDEEGYKATLNIMTGGSVVVEGTLTNNGFINVDGGTLTAVTIVNNGSITLNNATFNVTNLTGTGTLTMLGNSHVTDESGSDGVEVESIVVKTESNAVALSSSAGTIVFGGVQEVTEAANTEITTLAANESVAIAWHFDVSGIESGESVTIETTIKTGLNDSEIKIFHKGDEVGAEWTEADVSDVNYDATTGKLSFKANSFSSYAVAVPEPSMFGLFAGLGALLLVGTRRRRR